MHKDLSDDQPAPELPQGFMIRTAVPGQDEPVIHALIEEAFDWRERDHVSFEDWKKLMIHPDSFNPDLWFLAIKDNQIIGTCLCFKHSDIGWIRQLAVKKPYRKLGIGRALLQRSFQAFKSLGLPKGGLAVESVNKNAVDFYLSAGMVKAVHLDEYVKEV